MNNMRPSTPKAWEAYSPSAQLRKLKAILQPSELRRVQQLARQSATKIPTMTADELERALKSLDARSQERRRKVHESLKKKYATKAQTMPTETFPRSSRKSKSNMGEDDFTTPRRTSRRAALAPAADPKQMQLPFVDRGCIAMPDLGRNHWKHAPDHPYKICLTRNQAQTLWGPRGPKIVRKGKSNASIGNKLGCGVFACAWSRDKDTAVKITNDQSDIEGLKLANAAGLHKGPYAVVPKLYRAFTLKSPNTSRRPVYGMIVEKLRAAKALPNGATDGLRCIINVQDAGWDPPAIKDRCCNRARIAPEVRKYCNSMAEQMEDIVPRLNDLGISTQDLHEENIGLGRDGRWKMLDLGLSGLPRKKRAAPTLRGAGYQR